MRSKGARTVALAATIGNMLQGWDSAAIAGALLYIKPEFNLENNPTLEGLVVASTLIGAVSSTTCAGPAADWLGRRSMLVVSAFFFSIGACVMAWSPDVYVLILARVLIGCSIGLASTISPIHIAESSPPEIRGQLSTLPQLMGSGGLFVAYAMVFVVSLTANPNWRFMLAVILFPSLVFLLFALFYLPESPRWLVSKGRMLEAKMVLQDLRGTEDVAAELALLVEGLGMVQSSRLEEWLLHPEIVGDVESAGDDGTGTGTFHTLQDQHQAFAWIPHPILEEPESQRLLSRKASMEPGQGRPLIDPVVTVIGSLQDHLIQEWEEEPNHNAIGYFSDDNMAGEGDENLKTPLLLSRPSSGRLDLPGPGALSRRSSANFFPPSPLQRKDSRHGHAWHAPGDIQPVWTAHGQVPANNSNPGSGFNPGTSLPESLSRAGNIGSGWQLAWRWTPAPDTKPGSDPHDGGSLQRVYLLSEPVRAMSSHAGSTLSLPGIGEVEAFQAAALVSQPAQILSAEHSNGPAVAHPLETVSGPSWQDLLVPGVRRALFVGLGLQILQQFSGINAVLYFTPQILQASGAEVLLARIGVGADSASILASGVTCLLMLPCIVLAMRLMDRAGRRQLLLATLPLLALALICVVISNSVLTTGLVQAAISFAGVAVFTCAFVMGFGPIPNIMCSEIFPTRVRGLCIGMCQAAMWVCNIIVTYSFPVLNRELGLEGVFCIFALVTVIAWVFVFLKVPETKGLPLEVISEFFAMAAVESKKPPVDVTDTYSISSKV